jgi:hypothetical protein
MKIVPHGLRVRTAMIRRVFHHAKMSAAGADTATGLFRRLAMW